MQLSEQLSGQIGAEQSGAHRAGRSTHRVFKTRRSAEEQRRTIHSNTHNLPHPRVELPKLSISLSCSGIRIYKKKTSSLSAEGMINGKEASQIKFMYQAAVLGRKEKGGQVQLLGNGAMISYNWILSVAQAFMQDSHNLKDFVFTVAIGQMDLKRITPETEELIAEVHTYLYNAETFENDIAMAKTDQYLSMLRMLDFNVVSQPRPRTVYHGLPGVVSGYGDSTDSTGNSELHYIDVTVSPASQCAEDFPETAINEEQHFCAGPEEEEVPTGVCWDDIGSPLVMDLTVAGLVSRTHRDCDDTTRGALYTNLPPYYHFIYKTMEKINLKNVVTHPTRRFD